MSANNGIIKFLLWNLWISKFTTISASSEAGVGHFVDSSQDPSRNATWRSSDLSDQFLFGDLGEAHKVGAIAIVYPQVPSATVQALRTTYDLATPSTTATVRARVSNSSSMVPVLYDSGVTNVWESILSTNEILEGQNSEYFSEGTNIPNDATRTFLPGMTKVFILPAEVTGRFVRIDLSDPDNALPYMDVSYIFVGRYLEPSPDLLYGWRLRKSEASRKPQATGGTMWPARIFQRTTLSMSLGAQTESSLTAYWALLSVLLGTRKEIIVQVIDSSSSFRFFTTIYGRFTIDQKFTNIGFRRYGIPLEIGEIVA